MTMMHMFLLLGLAFGTSFNHAFAEEEKTDKKRGEKNSFVKSGRSEGNEMAYDFVFKNKLGKEVRKEAKETAMEAFNVPENYELVTNRRDDEELVLHYGDLVRIWSEEVEGYVHTHRINYYHEKSSKQQQATIYAPRDGHDRAAVDNNATWWMVTGGYEKDVTMGAPVDPSQPVNFVAVEDRKTLVSSSESFSRVVARLSRALHSHSLLKHKKTSPIVEYASNKKEKKGKEKPKQEVTAHYKRDTNDNWSIRASHKWGEKEEVGLGARITLMHTESQWYLRGNKDIMFDIHGGDDNEDNTNMQHEISCVRDRNHPQTTFRIGLIARKRAARSEDLIQEYLDDAGKNKLVTIKVIEQDGTEFKDHNLLNQVGRRLFVHGHKPDSTSDYKMSALTCYRSLFRLKKDGKIIGIESYNSDYYKGYMLQQERKDKTWKSMVLFENKNFKDHERWQFVPTENGRGVHIQLRNSRYYLRVRGNDTNDLNLTDVNGGKTKIHKRRILEATSSKSKAAQFKIQEFKPKTEDE
jgi:hypothetical protein